jgi:hypothetical protein
VIVTFRKGQISMGTVRISGFFSLLNIHRLLDEN